MSGNELIKPEEIQSRIYTARGTQVMLDKDLEDEAEFMVSQNAIPSKQYLGGSLYYVFTEQGVATIFHGWFLIIDDTTVYHFGASLKDLGKKWFAFSKMDIGAVEMLGRLV